jgi:hypothetical protein
MFNRIHRVLALASSLALCGIVVVPQLADASQSQGRAARAEHAVAGEIRSLDQAAKTVVIHTADGVDDTVKFTGQTTVRGAREVTRAVDATAKASLEGGAVVLHYSGEGADKTAVSIEHLGKRTLKTLKGTVVRVDDGSKFFVVKTRTGAEESFELTKDLVVDTRRGTGRAVAETGGAIERGAEVAVHYSDEGGKKLVYLVRRS